MRIVHIVRMNNEGDIGGVEYHVKYITQYQLKMGQTPIIVNFSLSSEDSISTSVQDGITWHEVKIKYEAGSIHKKLKQYEGKGIGLLVMLLERIRYNFYAKQLFEYISELNPDIIHQHDYLPSVNLSKKLSKKYPTVFTNHFGEYLYLEKTFITRWLQNYLIKDFHQVIAPSIELLPKRPNSHHIVNGYDDEKFSPITNTEHTKLKKALGCDGKIVILCARRWAPTKGIIFLSKALNLLAPDVKAKLVILFAGNESSDYQLYKSQILEELNKASACDIRLLGNLDHSKLLQYMNVCDLAVIPSLMEAISLFAVEALGSGKPVLASDTGGLPEIIKHNKNGWLVPKGDAEALAETISRISNGYPESIPQIDVNYYKNNYSWRSIAEKVFHIYQKALEQKAGL